MLINAPKFSSALLLVCWRSSFGKIATYTTPNIITTKSLKKNNNSNLAADETQMNIYESKLEGHK